MDGRQGESDAAYLDRLVDYPTGELTESQTVLLAAKISELTARANRTGKTHSRQLLPGPFNSGLILSLLVILSLGIPAMDPFSSVFLSFYFYSDR